MKRLLYIGNNVNNKRSNVSTIQTLSALLQQEGYTVYLSSSSNSKVLRMMGMLFNFFQRFKTVDVILIDTYSTLNFNYAFIMSQLARIFRVPYIPSLNGGNLPHRLKRSPLMSKMIFSNAAVNITPSIYLLEAFKSHGYHNITYIPNTIVLDKYHYQFKAISTIQLLWVRSFSSIYNPQMAVSVLHALQQQGNQASLTMVGPDADGSLKEVKQLAEQLGVTVNFTGKLPKPQWHALAKQHNVFINTTHFDNMPVSVIEAMALGLPVVSTGVGGMPYLVKDGVDGLLVPDGDVKAMVAGILKLKEDPELAQNISAAARVKAEGFDWNVVREKWIKVLSS
ncbi:glycosyltransferase family 4 protein [Paucihalobacter ruber]|uniref:Glycosyltransferase family 4 protein n=1 Tax=Paucihalobacter ruber TaxID=2567861 RepID=A0A506PIZ5_9FLAO|nr:glycosyltransferase family 4 protein [Paucihalobacter ruber]TPV33836.1 glycosyltransferase family 4 protein [Paucihalobacter ruber]